MLVWETAFNKHLNVENLKQNIIQNQFLTAQDTELYTRSLGLGEVLVCIQWCCVLCVHVWRFEQVTECTVGDLSKSTVDDVIGFFVLLKVLTHKLNPLSKANQWVCGWLGLGFTDVKYHQLFCIVSDILFFCSFTAFQNVLLKKTWIPTSLPFSFEI